MKRGGGDDELLRYTVSMKRANTHYFDVDLVIPLPPEAGKSLKLTMPVWTPGSYNIENFSKNVLDLKAADGDTGTPLGRMEKESKSTWTLSWDEDPRTIRISYSVYAFAYEVTKSYLDTFHAVINGASVFIYPVGMENERARVTLVPYNGWKRVSTGLEQVSDFEFLADNLDLLMDSPVEVGNQDIRTFEVAEIPHEVSIFGEAPVDRERLVDDIKKIVERTSEVFGDIPYRKYVFIVDFTEEGGGGLEHLNSTLCIIPRLRFVPKEEYDSIMNLFSHEFFHTWNVKRMRPKGLGPFDYSSEVYTKSLWIAEGFTTYYGDHLLRRAGIYSVAEYLDSLARNISQMKNLPGWKWQSAQEASFDTWIKFNKLGANQQNVTMSYYTQGALVGWMLDLQVRKNTGCEKTLDDLMRNVYRRTYVEEGRGYTDEEFEAAAVEVGGSSVRSIFGARVKGREPIDFDRYLGYAGLKLAPKDAAQKEEGFLGVKLSSEGGRMIVRMRLQDSPAEAMGLAAGDEIVGIDGLRLLGERASFYISTTAPETPIKLTVARNGVLKGFEGRLGKKPAFEEKVVPLKEADEEQKAIFKSWMQSDWSPEIVYPEFTRSPERRPVFDYV
ncbi:MAG: M61 family metallopeptidase [Nitrososphaerota archaeon]|nr:M61 family metallopeptidase [Nitrososphaerota archaeon]